VAGTGMEYRYECRERLTEVMVSLDDRTNIYSRKLVRLLPLINYAIDTASSRGLRWLMLLHAS
jgi:hypothetical protein